MRLARAVFKLEQKLGQPRDVYVSGTTSDAENKWGCDLGSCLVQAAEPTFLAIDTCLVH